MDKIQKGYKLISQNYLEEFDDQNKKDSFIIDCLESFPSWDAADKENLARINFMLYNSLMRTSWLCIDEKRIHNIPDNNTESPGKGYADIKTIVKVLVGYPQMGMIKKS